MLGPLCCFLLQAVQDERQHEEAVANDALVAPPLERLHLALTQMRQRANGRGRMGLGAAGLVDMKMELVERAAGEIFQFARIEGQHVLALTLEGALLAVENNQFQKAADVSNLNFLLLLESFL